LLDNLVAAVPEGREQLVEKLGLLVLVGEAELLDAAESQDDLVESPEEIERQEPVAGLAEVFGELVDVHGAGISPVDLRGVRWSGRGASESLSVFRFLSE
jgi:hypothetical protein